jgi:hypothetical protein
MVARRAGELVDARLVDREPGTRAEGDVGRRGQVSEVDGGERGFILRVI